MNNSRLVLIFCLSALGSALFADSTIPPLNGIIPDDLTKSRAFRAPNFKDQSGVLGYDKSTFDTPPGLATAVQFWTNVYTNFTSHQGIIHDTDNLDIIYSSIDFDKIKDYATLSSEKQVEAREDLIANEKERIQKILIKFKDAKNLEGFSEEELKLWKMFEKIKDSDKFTKFAETDRIRFQQGLNDRMQRAIYLSGRYLEDMEIIFKEEGLPVELTRLVFVESSFNIYARSKVGASGIWQIMKYTGKGRITINESIDQRNDPLVATKLAAKILKSNYKMLESWPLAITGYNHGPAGVRRLAKRNQTKDLATLVASDNVSHRFGFASRNFYASFLAALNVESNTAKFYPNATWSEKLKLAPLKLKKPLKYEELKAFFDNDEKRMQGFNPHIHAPQKKQARVLNRGTIVYIPPEKG